MANPMEKLYQAAKKNENFEIFLDRAGSYQLYGYVHKYQNASPRIRLMVINKKGNLDLPIYYDHNDTIAFDSLNVSKTVQEKSLLIMRSIDLLNDLIFSQKTS